MTFTYDNADLSATIKRYRHKGSNYYIEYLDGSKSDYYCSSENESQRIEQIMLDQALDRQGMMDLQNMSFAKTLAISGAWISSAACSILYNNDKFVLGTLAMTGIVTGCIVARSEAIKIQELKKYKMFLEMYSDLHKINETELLSNVEPEPIYQYPLTINNVDNYSYGQMKTLYKKFNETLYR